MTDKDLFNFYLQMKDEGDPFNISPMNLYMELETRDFLDNEFVIFPEINVCNIGIGVGEWDDYLGYCLKGKGQHTSVDIDEGICERFAYRQMREKHPNPSKVICENILETTLPKASFDLITLIGSTVNEIGDYDETFKVIASLLKSGGELMYMDILQYKNTIDDFRAVGKKNGLEIIKTKNYSRYESIKFYNVKAKKK
jgi:ubiquinone/menaquinone biosynthesis C-methylase UbiE